MTEEQRQRIEKIQRIEGDRVYLRRITEADTDNILRWRNMPHVVERFIYRAEVTRTDHEKWLAEQVGTGRVEQFIIVIREMTARSAASILPISTWWQLRRNSASLSGKRMRWVRITVLRCCGWR